MIHLLQVNANLGALALEGDGVNLTTLDGENELVEVFDLHGLDFGLRTKSTESSALSFHKGLDIAEELFRGLDLLLAVRFGEFLFGLGDDVAGDDADIFQNFHGGRRKILLIALEKEGGGKRMGGLVVLHSVCVGFGCCVVQTVLVFRT